MFKWLKYKLLNKYLEDLYEYTLRRLIIEALELYDNTWDKERVRHIILGLEAINIEAYAKDEELHKLIENKIKYK